MISIIKNLATSLIPEGRFKDSLRSYFHVFSDFQNEFSNLSYEGIESSEYLEEENEVRLELSNGLTLFSYPTPPHLVHRYRVLAPSEKCVPPECVYAVLIYNEVNDYAQLYAPSKGDVIVDAGAHVGMYTARVSREVGSEGHVFAFEPSPQNVRYLRKNIRENGLDNITVVEKGLWKESTKKDFSAPVEGFHNPSVFHDGDDTFRADLDTLDSLLTDCGPGKGIDFIKMDIEGAELEVLSGAKNTLQQDRPEIAIASYHERDGESTSKRIEEILSELDYECSTIEGHETTTYGNPGDESG